MARLRCVLLLLLGASSCLAFLPHDLSNWQARSTLLSLSCLPPPDIPPQGNWPCADDVLMGKPRTIAELQLIVAEGTRVRGVGAGHSWWGEQFCAGTGSNAVGVLTTTLEDQTIRLDAVKKTAKIPAGLITHDVLDALTRYTSSSAPNGWTLGGFPWFCFQTIGGAVATGSHGSSMRYGSLSSDEQLLSIDIVLANGSFVQMTRQSHPFLWRAVQVSAGRLGIITSVTMRIVKNDNMYRWRAPHSWKAFFADMKAR